MKSILQRIKNIVNIKELETSELKEVQQNITKVINQIIFYYVKISFQILEHFPVGQRNQKHIALITQELRTIDFFKKLEDARGEESTKLCAMQLKYEKHLSNSDVIIHGERGDKFYIILQGILEVHVPNSLGQFVKVGELKAGQSFGELALINDSPRRATIKAQTDCDLAVLSKDDYMKIIGKQYKLYNNCGSQRFDSKIFNLL